MISTAIDPTRVSRVIGYKLAPGLFREQVPYLPQRIAVLGEANTANQATITTDPFEFINADQVGAKYGYGSPLHQMARILRPKTADFLGGIQTVIYPQKETGAPTATVIISDLAFVSGTEADANEVHTLAINGRTNIDGQRYAINIEKGDNKKAIVDKAVLAVNGVIGSPVIAVNATDTLELTTKWKGATAADLTVSVETGDNKAGITWSPESTKTDGTGAQDIGDTMDAFGDTWNTVVLNPYGSDQFEALETANGVPDPEFPTGRYDPKQFKPFVALFGNTDHEVSTIAAITGAADRKSQVTNAMCPAPKSDGWPWEAAANMALIATTFMQRRPWLGVAGVGYFDMPAGADAGEMGKYENRDVLATSGASTVTLESGQYIVQDFITTYHPDGELPPKFRFVRDLNIDWNIGYGWKLIMERDIQDKAIVADDSPSTVDGTISPKQAKQLVISFIEIMERRAIVADSEFTVDNTLTGINPENPARLDISFKYKRTSTAHQVSSDAEVDFFYQI